MTLESYPRLATSYADVTDFAKFRRSATFLATLTCCVKWVWVPQGDLSWMFFVSQTTPIGHGNALTRCLDVTRSSPLNGCVNYEACKHNMEHSVLLA